MKIGYHASHEQFSPRQLLQLAERAQAVGFAHLLSSDHFHPWTGSQGHSGHSFTWLGAALERLPLDAGMVTAPGQRNHPAITAQALATLADLYPGRIWAALGSGQALNECITGQGWPSKEERNHRLRESVDIMRALWAGQEVTSRGRVVVEQARLFTLPPVPPKLFVAAMTAETAEWGASWADGLITVSQAPSQLRPIVEAFRRGGGVGKPMYLKVQLSWAADEQQALLGAHEQWAGNVYPSSVLTELRTPEQFEALAQATQPELLRKHVRISSDLSRHVDWLAADLELGFERLFLHNVNRDQERFIEAFGTHVLPKLE